MSPNQAIFTDKIICSSPLAAAHPLTDLVAKALNPSLFRHACRMAIGRNACSLPDFPEFAQTVRYGVSGTPMWGSASRRLSAGVAGLQLSCVGPGSGSLIIIIPISGDDLARNDVIFPKTPGNCKDASDSCCWAQACRLFFCPTRDRSGNPSHITHSPGRCRQASLSSLQRGATTCPRRAQVALSLA